MFSYEQQFKLATMGSSSCRIVKLKSIMEILRHYYRQRETSAWGCLQS